MFPKLFWNENGGCLSVIMEKAPTAAIIADWNKYPNGSLTMLDLGTLVLASYVSTYLTS